MVTNRLCFEQEKSLSPLFSLSPGSATVVRMIINLDSYLINYDNG